MPPPIAAVQAGMIAAMPVIMVGTTVLIFFILGSPSVGEGGALLPFWRVYEKKCLEEEAENEANAA